MFIFSKQSSQEFIDFTDITFGGNGGQPQPHIDANADFITLDKNNTVTINPLDNDTADTTLDSITTAPQHGTATINGSSIDYTPNADYVGQDIIKYKIKDADGNEDEGSIFIYVADVLPEPTICDSSPYKCKIIANKGSQGVGVIFDNKITTTIANNSGDTIEIQNGGVTESLNNGESKVIECGTQPYFELYKLYPTIFDVDSIGDYRIEASNTPLGVEIVNQTGGHIIGGVDINHLDTVANGDNTGIHNTLVVARDNNSLADYVEPTRPTPPTPAHYSDISINTTGNYRIEIVANGSEDCKVTNATGADIYDVISGDSNTETIANGANIVMTDDRFFSNDEFGVFTVYNEPTRPTPPTPAHYSHIVVNSINSSIAVTATSNNDCDIINHTGSDIKVGDIAVSNNNGIVITETKTITL